MDGEEKKQNKFCYEFAPLQVKNKILMPVIILHYTFSYIISCSSRSRATIVYCQKKEKLLPLFSFPFFHSERDEKYFSVFLFSKKLFLCNFSLYNLSKFSEQKKI